jgi:hypothetical protein
MEQYIQGQSRDLIDKAYTKLVSFIPLQSCTCLHSWYTYFADLVHKFVLVLSSTVHGHMTCGILWVVSLFACLSTLVDSMTL